MRVIVMVLAVLLGVGIAATSVAAHSGRTDKNGCHYDRKAGTRHCH